MICPICQTLNPANQRFCLECGTRLSAPEPPAFPPAIPQQPTPEPPPATTPTPPPAPVLFQEWASSATPAATATSQQETTGLASASRWVGIASISVMGAAVVIALIALLTQSGGALAGFSLLIGMLPLLGGPIAVVLGLMALANPKLKETFAGRRHVITGITTGLSTVLLCCVLLLLMPSSSSS